MTEITFLPSFSDIFSTLNSLFAVNQRNGITVKANCSLSPEIQGTFFAGLGTPRISRSGQSFLVQVDRSAAGFLSSKIHDYVSFSVGGQAQNGRFLGEIQVQGIVSPFFIINGNVTSDGRNYQATAQVSARQPFSHINALFNDKNNLIGGSAVFGNENVIIGCNGKFKGMIDKLASLNILGYFRKDKSTAAASFSIKGRRSWKAKWWTNWELIEDLHFGFKVKYDSMGGISAFCGYNANIGRTTVKGRIGSDGVVSSELCGKLTPNVLAAISASLDHKQYEYTLGLDLTYL